MKRPTTRPVGAPSRGLLPALFVSVLLAACGGARLEETPPPRPPAFPESPSDTAAEGGADSLLAQAAQTTYRLYVADDSSGEVVRVAFVPGRGVRVENRIPRAAASDDLRPPRGLAVSPDGRRWYLSVARVAAVGSVLEYAAGPDTLTARADVGFFPTAMATTPDGQALLVANSDLEAPNEPSSLSALRLPELSGARSVTTCPVPRGSRTSRSGVHLYSTCEAADQLVEVDPSSLEVTKRYSVTPGSERSLALSNVGVSDVEPPPGADRIEVRPELRKRCSPTWVEPAMGTRSDRIVYVACNGNDDVVAVDTDEWRVTERYAAGSEPLELEATEDGHYLAVTLHGDRSVALLDLDRDGREETRLATRGPGPSGVAASPDSRYLFVTSAGDGSAPGGLDVFDLRTLERVATLRLGPRPGAVAFWEIGRLGR